MKVPSRRIFASSVIGICVIFFGCCSLPAGPFRLVSSLDWSSISFAGWSLWSVSRSSFSALGLPAFEDGLEGLDEEGFGEQGLEEEA